jgi:hypothetical protein
MKCTDQYIEPPRHNWSQQGPLRQGLEGTTHTGNTQVRIRQRMATDNAEGMGRTRIEGWKGRLSRGWRGLRAPVLSQRGNPLQGNESCVSVRALTALLSLPCSHRLALTAMFSLPCSHCLPLTALLVLSFSHCLALSALLSLCVGV